jgi:hypothetical protein
MRYSRRLRLAGFAAVIGGVLLATTGCQSRPTPAPTPTASKAPHATSLYVRNYTASDVVVYAVPKPGGRIVWLSTIPVGASRTLPIEWSDLQANGGLVVRTQLAGSTKSWTSEPLIIDEGIVAVLEVRTDASRSTVASVLRGVTTQAFGNAMWW